MAIKPIGERVLIKPKTEEKTKGGIYLPAGSEEDTNEGTIVEIGQKKEGDMPVKKGDKVMFEPFSATEVNVDGEKHFIIKLDRIIAIIE